MNPATAMQAVRYCTLCDEAISAGRLRVVPNAKQCVRCLERSGDVPMTRRYDEHTKQGIVSTTYFSDQQINTHVNQNDITAAEEFLESFTDGVLPVEEVDEVKTCQNTIVQDVRDMDAVPGAGNPVVAFHKQLDNHA